MINYNRIVLGGRLTFDPQVKQTPQGLSICKLNMAVNHKVKEKEEVCFVEVVCFGTTADACEKALKKGSQVLIEGRLKFDQWEAEGVKKSRHSIAADRVIFVDAQAKNDSMQSFGQDEALPF